MKAPRALYDSRQSAPAGSPTWWLVFNQEFRDLWIGGKALTLLLLFTVLLGIMSYMLASNSELSLIPPKEMAYLTVQAAIAVGVFISLIIGADSLSGERERSTLEAMLLTPTSRRQIVIGKFLAGITPWPGAFLVSIPYVLALSQGDEVFRTAMVLGAVLGTILAPAFTAFGMLVSLWSNSNKTSMFASLTAYVLAALPTQFPGSAQTGTWGRLLKRLNPLEATDHFLEKILVNNRTWGEFGDWLAAPIIFAVVSYVLLFWFSSPRLRLEGGNVSAIRWPWARPAVLLVACLVAAGPAWGQGGDSSSVVRPPLSITIDTYHVENKNGDKVPFTTVVTNNGQEPLPYTTVAMNIIKLSGEGDPVDPEDWAPERTQGIETLGPGESVTHSWTVNTIFDGNYMVYMVAIVKPTSPNITSMPVVSPGIHLTVHPFARANPSGILPYVIATPIVLVLGIVFLLRRRRRSIDAGGS